MKTQLTVGLLNPVGLKDGKTPQYICHTFWIVGSLVSRQTKSRDQSKRATANVCTLDSKLNASFYKHKSI